MKVVDAGVIVNLLIGDLDFGYPEEAEIAVPHLVDTEVVNVLRNLVRRGRLTEAQGEVAFAGFRQLALTRFPADWLRDRMWELRHDLSTYDATYVALAEVAGASSLLTTDARLAHAPGVSCRIDLLQ